MKLNKLWAGVLALLSLSACSKDLEPAVSSESSAVAKTKLVHVNLSAAQNPEDLRVTFGLGSNGAISGLQMSDRNVILRVAVSRPGGTTVSQDLEFVKSPHGNSANYSGQLEVPNDGSGDYKIAALLIREVGEESEGARVFLGGDAGSLRAFKAVQSVISLPGSPTLDINMPYTSDWQDLRLSGDGNSVVERVVLRMKPRGTILRVRVQNETNQEQKFERIRFFTHLMTSNGDFILDAPEPDNSVRFASRTMRNTVTFTPKIESEPLSVAAGSADQPTYSPWVYLWVMPMKGEQGTSDLTRVYLHVEGVDQPYLAAQTTLPLNIGSQRMTLPYRGGIGAIFDNPWESPEDAGAVPARFESPLKRISDFAVSAAGNSFVTDLKFDNPDLKTYSLAEALAQFGSPVEFTDGHRYSLPTREELNAIFAPEISINSLALYYAKDKNLSIYNVMERDVKLGEGIVGNFYSDVLHEGTTRYAIRFKGGDDRYRTAFRYSLIDVEGEHRLIIESIHLGSDATTLADLKDDSFWNKPDKVKKEFPYYGIYTTIYNPGSDEPLLSHRNTYLVFWSSQIANRDFAHVGLLAGADPWVGLREIDGRRLFVYLWKRD